MNKFNSQVYRGILILFMLVLIGGQSAFGQVSLTDIQGDQSEEAIRYLVNNNVIQGYSDGTFQPNRRVNRAEFTKILVGGLLNGAVPARPSESCFSDVGPNEWYSPYICYAKTQNLISGYPNGTFQPAGEINLAEAAKIIANTYNLQTNTANSSPWYRSFIEVLQNDSIIPASFSRLDQKVSRSQMAEMIWRISTNQTNRAAARFNFSTSNNLEYIAFRDNSPAAGNVQGNCSVPVAAQQVDISNPDQIIGDGTAASCTSQAFIAAVGRGGKIIFNCGPDPVTIQLQDTARVRNDQLPDIVIDGGGLITLDGQNRHRILYQNTCDQSLAWTTSHCDNQNSPRLTVQNLTFINGNSTDADNLGGGAIFARGGSLKIINSRFFNNTCDPTGPDIGGGAVRALDQYNDQPLYIVNSTFGGTQGTRNSCSNGGAISSIGVSYSIFNSLFTNNTAVGNGANPARANTPGGGSGGAIYNDGNQFNLNICGTRIADNQANEGGGAIFFVSNNRSGALQITNSSLTNNLNRGFETAGYPGIFFSSRGNPQINNSLIE